MIDRESLYDYWVLNLPSTSPKPTADALIINGGYLMRNASIYGKSLNLKGDITQTTSLEIIAGAPANTTQLTFNGKKLKFTQDEWGIIKTEVEFTTPKIQLPNLASLEWYYKDTLPELQPQYSDNAWTSASHPYTNNTYRPLTTPTSLYSSDYGFHTGSLIYRGRFIANGNETKLSITAQGGSAFGFSTWLGSEFLGSYVGTPEYDWINATFTLPPGLVKGKEYIINVLIDMMGLDEDLGVEEMKTPRGIPDFELLGHPQSDIKWKLTGNLGGEQYLDKARGPLNEGALWAERQGYHQPNPPVQGWEKVQGGPMKGIGQAGVGFYVTSFELDFPHGYDIPLSFDFANSTASNYRAQIYVNGWQFGKYINNIGPQTGFPVPEGILNHHGTNWVAVSLWAMDWNGAKLDGLSLKTGTVAQWVYNVAMVDSPTWKKRTSAY